MKHIKTKTQDEINALKSNWLSDPCWDIEDTKGFEEYRLHLTLFMERKWGEERKGKVIDKIRELDIDSYSLAEYIVKLEDRIQSLENRLEKFMNPQ